MKEKLLKPYMGYSRDGGSQEGAILIFAHNIREAKRLGYPAMCGIIVDDYTDMVVKWLKNSNFLFEQAAKWSKDKISIGVAHAVDNPLSCKGCERWGYELNDEGYCDTCADDMEE